MTTRPVLANAGAMNQFIGAFEVTSKLSGHVYACSFSHIWNGIATRHSDTIDAKFVVEVGRIVGLAHSAFVEFRDKAGRDLTDREGKFYRGGVFYGNVSKKRMSGRFTMCRMRKLRG